MAISSRALDAALALAANPHLASTMRRQELPPDVGALLRALSGDAAEVARLANMARLDDRRLIDALENYVQQIMLCQGAPAHRILGVSPTASRDAMRTHMRLLMIWLHPDRLGAEWRAAFSGRVLEAWRAVQKDSAPQENLQPGLRPAANRPLDQQQPDKRMAPRQRARSGRQPRPLTRPWRQAPIAPAPPWFKRKSAIVAGGALLLLVALVAMLDAFYSAAQTARLMR